MTADPIAHLVLALDATEKLISSIGNERLTLPTPCTEWTVRDIVHHLVVGNHHVASAFNGEPSGRKGDPQGPEADLFSAYRGSGLALLDAVRRPGALEMVVTVPFGSVTGAVAVHLRVTELLVHGWDLAQATGRPIAFPEDLAERALRFSQSALTKLPPGRAPFAPPAPVPDDAAAIDRLAACLGRQVVVDAALSET